MRKKGSKGGKGDGMGIGHRVPNRAQLFGHGARRGGRKGRR